MQQYADIYLLPNYCTCFGRPSRPSSGVHKTVFADSGTDRTVRGASSPDSMMAVDGCDGRPKHVAVSNVHTVGSRWISSTKNYDARNHEYKIYQSS